MLWFVKKKNSVYISSVVAVKYVDIYKILYAVIKTKGLFASGCGFSYSNRWQGLFCPLLFPYLLPSSSS